MTKAQIKAAVQQSMNKFFGRHEEDKTLEKLMNLNEQYGSGHRWCSYQQNLVDIIKAGNERAISIALTAFEEHCKIEGACEAINNVAVNLNFMDF